MTRPDRARQVVRPAAETQPNRRRAWRVRNFGQIVFVRQFIDDLRVGEDVTDEPPTVRMTRAEWLTRHAEFGYNADFTRRQP